MKRQYVKFFKRDKTPVWELTLKFLKNVIFVGDLIVPFLEDQTIDEVRFYDKEISFIIDGRSRQYKYNQVRAIISHSYSKKKKNVARIKIQFLADDNKKYNIELNENKRNVMISKFSKNTRDFLFQVAKKCPRLTEQRFKQTSPLFSLGIAMLVIFVLVN